MVHVNTGRQGQLHGRGTIGPGLQDEQGLSK